MIFGVKFCKMLHCEHYRLQFFDYLNTGLLQMLNGHFDRIKIIVANSTND